MKQKKRRTWLWILGWVGLVVWLVWGPWFLLPRAAHHNIPQALTFAEMLVFCSYPLVFGVYLIIVGLRRSRLPSIALVSVGLLMLFVTWGIAIMTLKKIEARRIDQDWQAMTNLQRLAWAHKIYTNEKDAQLSPDKNRQPYREDVER